MSRNTRRRFLSALAVMGVPAIGRAQAQTQSQTSAAPPPAILVCERVQQDATHKITYKQKFTEDKGRLKVYSVNDSIVIDRPVRTMFEPGYAAFVEKGGDHKLFNLMNGIALTVEWPKGTTSKVQFFARIKVPQTIGDVTVTYTVGTDAPKPMYYPVKVQQAPVIGHADISFYWIDPPANIATRPVTVHLAAYGKPIGSIEFNLMRLKWKDVLARHDADLASKRDVVVSIDGTVNVPGCYVEEAMPCFFTTAAVHTLGLTDDCWELRSLRRFRDGPLGQMTGGADLIDRYYAEAPGVVAAIGQRDDASRIWTWAYWRYILPCAVMTRLGLTSLALAHYRRLVGWLTRIRAER